MPGKPLLFNGGRGAVCGDRKRPERRVRETASPLGCPPEATASRVRPPRWRKLGTMTAPFPLRPNGEVLAGLVERVTFHDVESGFAVLRVKARGYRDLVTIVGHAAAIAAGE